jgi:hypothetical protein
MKFRGLQALHDRDEFEARAGALINNQESRRLRYGLLDWARGLVFQQICEEDLGTHGFGPGGAAWISALGFRSARRRIGHSGRRTDGQTDIFLPQPNQHLMDTPQFRHFSKDQRIADCTGIPEGLEITALSRHSR